MKYLILGLCFSFFASSTYAQNVGIGTHAPTQRLHVANGNILIQNPLNASSVLSMVSGSGNGLSIEVSSTGVTTLARLRPFQGGGAMSGVSIAQNNFTGIGLSGTPQYPLHVHGAFQPIAGIAFTHGSFSENPDDGMKVGLHVPAEAVNRYAFIRIPNQLPFSIWQGNQPRINIGSAGTVGIGMAPYATIAFNVNGYGYFFGKANEGALVAAVDSLATPTLNGSGFSASKRLGTGLNFINLLMQGNKPQAYIEANFKNGTLNQATGMVMFDSVGNVGIGGYILDSSLRSRLHIFGSQRIQNGHLFLHGNQNNFSAGSEIRFQYNPTGAESGVPTATRTWYALRHEDRNDENVNRRNTLSLFYEEDHFVSNFLDRRFTGLVINETGQVGIRRFPEKTLGESVKVDIEGATRINGGITLTGIGEANGRLLVSNANGVATWQHPATLTVDRSNAGISQFEFRNAGTYRGAIGWDQSAGRFFFFDGESNSNTLFINNGRLGIQRDPTTNALEVNGTASKSSAGDWIANSDERLKKNIASIQSPLQKLLQLKGITYEWNDQQTGMTRPTGTHMGFTAQNIQQVFPQLVTTDAQGFLQTGYGTYDALYVEAIKELLQKITQLEKRLAALEK